MSDSKTEPTTTTTTTTTTDGGAGAGAGPSLKTFKERDMTGKVCVVTGASGGLGAELAKRLAARHARVVLVARRADKLKAVADAIVAAGAPSDSVSCHPTDVTDLKSIDALVADLEKEFGDKEGVHCLVNNAGTMPGLGLPPPGVPDDHEVTCFRTNVEGSHFMTKKLLPLLARPSPDGFDRTVVFVSSCEAYLSEPTDGNGLLAYRASKAAVNGLMVGLHQLYKPDAGAMEAMVRGGADAALGRVVAVHPGYVKTSLGVETARMMEPELSLEEFAARKEWEEDFVSVEEGVDTLLWAAVANRVESGKMYEKRTVHSF